MEMKSKMGDDTCAAPFWPYGPGNNRYSSWILFFKHIKFVIDIWMNII
jgi:hypothetical protein